MNPQSSFTSPRLETLRAELEVNPMEAIERFWSEIEATGTPLIERFRDDPTAILVTFLWREREPLRNLRIFETLSSAHGLARARTDRSSRTPAGAFRQF
ncbi:MAG: hypothetical protein ACRDHN_09365 [Thermomicrobiales bacterium]